jgi:hypothetical protein
VRDRSREGSRLGPRGEKSVERLRRGVAEQVETAPLARRPDCDVGHVISYRQGLDHQSFDDWSDDTASGPTCEASSWTEVTHTAV